MQRRPEYVEPAENLKAWELPNASTHPLSAMLGRKFELISFRWLDEDTL